MAAGWVKPGNDQSIPDLKPVTMQAKQDKMTQNSGCTERESLQYSPDYLLLTTLHFTWGSRGFELENNAILFFKMLYRNPRSVQQTYSYGENQYQNAILFSTHWFLIFLHWVQVSHDRTVKLWIFRGGSIWKENKKDSYLNYVVFIELMLKCISLFNK